MARGRPAVILLPWHVRCHFSAALFGSHKTLWWKCAKHVYPAQLYFYLLSTWVSQEVGLGAEVMYSGVSIRISSRMGRCSTDFVYHCGPALTPSAEQHPWKVAAPRNDRLEQSDVAPSVCSSVVVFSASGGVWMRSSLGALSLSVAVSGWELSGRSSQLRIMGRKTPFV